MCPLFLCSNKGCQAIENTAMCGFWYRGGKKPLCSACDPQFGKWHGAFSKEKFNPKKWEYEDDSKMFIRKKDNK